MTTNFHVTKESVRTLIGVIYAFMIAAFLNRLF